MDQLEYLGEWELWEYQGHLDPLDRQAHQVSKVIEVFRVHTEFLEKMASQEVPDLLVQEAHLVQYI